jgi:DNA-binding PadR family transcriptional regulator
MKGFLTFLVLWLLKKKKMNGTELSMELKVRKGSKPSPGTIYPVLKDLKDKGLINVDKKKTYSLSVKGEKELETHIDSFLRTFCDIDEMKECCHRK